MSAPRPVPDPTCPGCGLTAAALRDSGRMGCARCYEAFAPMVARAVAELHGASVTPADAAAPSDPPPMATKPAAAAARLPWPARRGGALPAPAPDRNLRKSRK